MIEDNKLENTSNSLKEYARRLDAEGYFLEAITQYEKLIECEKGELLDYCNLLCLYFYCLDFGYCSSKKIPDEISSTAADKAMTVIARAESNFGLNDELTYWKNQIKFYGLGEGELGEWELIGNSLVPFVITAMDFPSKENIFKIIKLKNDIEVSEKSHTKSFLLGRIDQILN